MRTGSSVLGTLVVGCVLLLGGCGEDGTTPPGTVRFGQVGRMEITLEAPLRLGAGELRQELTWQSNGSWALHETISYGSLLGDERFLDNPEDPAAYAGAYAELNTLINEQAADPSGGRGLGLFLDGIGLTPDTIWNCAATRTRLTLHIVDELTADSVFWTACADGSLTNLTPRNAGPEAPSSRIVEVTRLARNGTVGERFLSQYAGSVPFGTLGRGDDSSSGVRTPVIFTDRASWRAFWNEHAPGTEAPSVDFSRDMVTAGIVGVREEAGDSVEVRRIVQVDQGTLVELWEVVPGDFCTPADRVHLPYHIVVSPRTPDPIRFAEVRVETVPCGG